MIIKQRNSVLNFLQSDKTVEYQQRYPDAGITEVKVNYIWKDNGIIQLGGLTF